MTFKELTNDVLSLCRETNSSNEFLLPAIRRAMRDIYTRKSMVKTVRLYSSGLRPTLYRKEIYIKGGTMLTVPLTGKAFSMRISGEGMYKIVDGDEVDVVEFNTGAESQLIRGLIHKGGTLSLYGYTSFMVFDLSVWEEIFSTRLANLPDGDQGVVFDIRALHEDFHSFISPARDAWGNPIEGSKLYDGVLEVPSDFRGEVILTYRILPTPPLGNRGEDEEDEIVNIPKEYEHILSLLTAYYYILAKNMPLAELLKLEYERLMLSLDSDCYEQIDNAYVPKVRWA